MRTMEGRTRRRLVRSAAAGVLGVALIAAAGTALALSESARDDFSAISYGGNNGALNWTGSWVEIGESDGPSAGVVDVVANNRCVANNCLRIGGDQVDVNGRGIWREVDLAGASSAMLTFSYRRNKTKATGTVTVAVSSNGGGKWSDLATYDFVGSSKRIYQNFDVTSLISSNTTIRFLAAGSGVNGYLQFDNIEIAAEFPGTSTTTTPAASTTTTTTPAASTTTTTTPVASALPIASTPPPDSGAVSNDRRLLTPIRGLSVALTTTVEALGENTLPAVVLGVLVAWLAILGLDRRGARRTASSRRP